MQAKSSGEAQTVSSDRRNQATPIPTYEHILKDNPGWFDEAVRTPEASRITGRPVATLETLRVRGGGPPFIQHGRTVTYRRRDLFEWMASGLRTSTSDAKPRVNM